MSSQSVREQVLEGPVNPDEVIHSEHWTYRLVPAGEWSRSKYQKTNQGAPTTEPRPHIIPRSQAALKMVIVDSAGFIGHTGLCPGIVLDNGEWTEGFRMIEIKASYIPELLADLDEVVRNQFMAAADE